MSIQNSKTFFQTVDGIDSFKWFDQNEAEHTLDGGTCNSHIPAWSSVTNTISDKSILPIMEITYGPLIHEGTVYILDSKLLASIVCFAELVQTGLWVFWAEQHAPYYTKFLHRPARKESDVPSKRVSKALLSNLYTVYLYCD